DEECPCCRRRFVAPDGSGRWDRCALPSRHPNISSCPTPIQSRGLRSRGRFRLISTPSQHPSTSPMAYGMQRPVPDLTDLSDEPPHVFELYGPDARPPGTFAANCLLARRLAERGVRFV